MMIYTRKMATWLSPTAACNNSLQDDSAPHSQKPVWPPIACSSHENSKLKKKPRLHRARAIGGGCDLGRSCFAPNTRNQSGKPESQPHPLCKSVKTDRPRFPHLVR